jgi:hypothetical protein
MEVDCLSGSARVSPSSRHSLEHFNSVCARIEIGMRTHITLAAMLIAAVCCGCSEATSISGRVVDGSGDAINGATIKVDQVGGSASHSVVSDEHGDYQVDFTHASSAVKFNVTASSPGFIDSKEELSSGQHKAHLIQLQPTEETKKKAAEVKQPKF